MMMLDRSINGWMNGLMDDVVCVLYNASCR